MQSRLVSGTPFEITAGAADLAHGRIADETSRTIGGVEESE